MTRITSTVLVMLILMNGTATIMEASGLSEDIGIEMETGVDRQMDQFVEDMRNGFSPNINIVESLISLTLAAVRVFFILVEAITVAPALMINILGGGAFVETVVYVLMGPMYMISTLEILYMATGSDPV